MKVKKKYIERIWKGNPMEGLWTRAFDSGGYGTMRWALQLNWIIAQTQADLTYSSFTGGRIRGLRHAPNL